MSSNAISNYNGAGNGSSGSSNQNKVDINGSESLQHQQPRTLYVGNLDPQVTEELIIALFAQMGHISGCKIIHEPGNDPYCFVEFVDHQAAANALMTMNKRQCLGRELKVNWATSPSTAGPKQDTSKHYHIFVGDLSPELETQQLREAFLPFGEISDCRVVRDPQTLKSKGYGFVSFVKKADAENAIQTMNGQWLGSRAIRTNWATRKPPTARAGTTGITGMNSLGIGDLGASGLGGLSGMNALKQLTFDEVYQQSSPTNCTVYCGGIIQGLCEEIIQKTFAAFGPIQEIRVFKDKGYAFIKFGTKEAATNAIVSVHNTEINGQTVKCSWGKETGDPTNQVQNANSLTAQYSYPYQQMGYWYPQGYPQIQNQFAAAVQASQSVPAYSAYGQYYNTAAAPNFNAAAVGMQMAWQNAAGVANQQHMSNAAAAAAVANAGSQGASQHQHLTSNLSQQAALMSGYPMQPYQAQ